MAVQEVLLESTVYGSTPRSLSTWPHGLIPTGTPLTLHGMRSAAPPAQHQRSQQQRPPLLTYHPAAPAGGGSDEQSEGVDEADALPFALDAEGSPRPHAFLGAKGQQLTPPHPAPASAGTAGTEPDRQLQGAAGLLSPRAAGAEAGGRAVPKLGGSRAHASDAAVGAFVLLLQGATPRGRGREQQGGGEAGRLSFEAAVEQLAALQERLRARGVVMA
jgi:hypothetical protein